MDAGRNRNSGGRREPFVATPGPLRLQTFPSSDRAFRSFAQAALHRLPAPLLEDLQRAIRVRYPLAVVRPQDDLAREPGAATIWYAFRYGSANPPVVDWAGTAAVAVVDDERRIVDLSDELSEIVELPRAAIVGRRLDEFTNPGDPTAREDLAALWDEFARVGILVSTLRFNYADGRPRELVFRIAADEAGPGRHRLLVRPLGGADERDGRPPRASAG